MQNNFNDQSDPFSSISPMIGLKLNEPMTPQSHNHHHHKTKSLPQAITNSKTSSNLIDLKSLDENSNSYSSYSSSSLSSLSNENCHHDMYIPDNNNYKYSCHNHKLKFYNRPRPQPNKCICKNEKLYNCFHCTSNYPISVRRSKDGEETNYVVNSSNNNNNNNNINSSNNNTEIVSHQSDDIDKSESSYSSSSSNDSSSQPTPKLILKPSPIPISPQLIALLTLTNPSNKFIPPPNKNLAALKQNNK